jgi:hypothetical protein
LYKHFYRNAPQFESYYLSARLKTGLTHVSLQGDIGRVLPSITASSKGKAPHPKLNNATMTNVDA